MRLIGIIPNENQAQKMVVFLKSRGIDNHCEVSFEPLTGYMKYHLWVVDEDRLEEASGYFSKFQNNPSDPEFDVPIPNEPTPVLPREKKRVSAPITLIVLGLCFLFFMGSSIEQLSMQQRGFWNLPFAMTSIQSYFMYDLPPSFETFQKKFQEIPSGQDFATLPYPKREELQYPTRGPFWHGIYTWLPIKMRHQDTAIVEGPLFTKIAAGQFWRLFSPCLLHMGFLHLLFNMLWLWMLGKPIEEKIGSVKTLSLTLLAGIGSNTAQYLVSGPLFLGYSGVVMGLVSFIWMRQKIAPWEGYSVHRATLYFLFVLVVITFVISFLSFLSHLVAETPFSLKVANTAHIVGALFGIVLGRSKRFAAKAVP